MGQKLAIDFGMTNSVVACWNDQAGAGEVLSIPGLSAARGSGRGGAVPSLLYILDGRAGRVAIGQAVLDDQLDRRRSNRLFRCFKRGITAGSGLDIRFIDGVPWTERDAGQHFLRALIQAVPFSPAEIEQLVVTVPVAAFDGYLVWLNSAIQADLSDKIRVVDESTAAALGYAITEPGAIVMVVDLGGGSADLSVVRLPQGRERTGSALGRLFGRPARQGAARVLAKTGLSLGGSDIDQWLLAEVLDRAGLSPLDLGDDYAPLLAACEQAKIALSAAEATEIPIRVSGHPSLNLAFRRDELEALLEGQGFYAALRSAVERVMALAHRRGIFEEDIHHVLLVGGVSLMPSVQRALEGRFQDQALRVDKPFTAVAEGALQVAAGFGLEDHLAHGYGLRHLDPHSGTSSYDEIIPMGSRYPTARPVQVLLGAAHPDQQAVEFVIGQMGMGAVSMVEVQYQEGQAVFVAQANQGGQQIVPLNEGAPTVVPLQPSGTPGEDRLRAEFGVDEQRRLRLTVVDLGTGRELLRDAVVVRLGEGRIDGAGAAADTGREPRLSSYRQLGRRRLSLRGLASMLDVLPPESISLAAMAEALRSPDCTVRYSAAEKLGRRGDRDARRILHDVLDGGTVPQRASVVRHLHRFSWFVAEPLFRQALADEDERVRGGAIFALCKMRQPEAYRLAEETLPGEGDMACLEVAWALGAGRDARAVPVLSIALQARDPKVREAVLESLSATEAPEAIPVVRRALADPDLEVRYAATLSLIDLAREDCFAELAGLVEVSRGQERERILRGFFHGTNYRQIDVAGSPDADRIVDALEVALGDDLPEVRVAAAMPLIRMDHERAASVLREGYYREQDSQARARMLYVAVLLESAVGQELLQDGLASRDPHVCETAEDLAEYLASG